MLRVLIFIMPVLIPGIQFCKNNRCRDNKKRYILRNREYLINPALFYSRLNEGLPEAAGSTLNIRLPARIKREKRVVPITIITREKQITDNR